MAKTDVEILGMPLVVDPRESGWYYVQWVPTEFPVRVWLWEGGELWGWNPNDDPETVKATANDNGVAIANIRWRKEL